MDILLYNKLKKVNVTNINILKRKKYKSIDNVYKFFKLTMKIFDKKFVLYDINKFSLIVRDFIDICDDISVSNIAQLIYDDTEIKDLAKAYFFVLLEPNFNFYEKLLLTVKVIDNDIAKSIQYLFYELDDEEDEDDAVWFKYIKFIFSQEIKNRSINYDKIVSQTLSSLCNVCDEEGSEKIIKYIQKNDQNIIDLNKHIIKFIKFVFYTIKDCHYGVTILSNYCNRSLPSKVIHTIRKEMYISDWNKFEMARLLDLIIKHNINKKNTIWKLFTFAMNENITITVNKKLMDLIYEKSDDIEWFFFEPEDLPSDSFIYEKIVPYLTEWENKLDKKYPRKWLSILLLKKELNELDQMLVDRLFDKYNPIIRHDILDKIHSEKVKKIVLTKYKEKIEI